MASFCADRRWAGSATLRRIKDGRRPASDNRLMAKMPVRPAHPESICWGCDRYCPATNLGCANGTIRTPHPCELFGDDWLEWALNESGGTDMASSARAGRGEHPQRP
jgi:hypothetical protein